MKSSAFLAANGAGKSTLLKILSRIAELTAGKSRGAAAKGAG